MAVKVGRGGREKEGGRVEGGVEGGGGSVRIGCTRTVVVGDRCTIRAAADAAAERFLISFSVKAGSFSFSATGGCVCFSCCCCIEWSFWENWS